jgi:aquaporin Z
MGEKTPMSAKLAAEFIGTFMLVLTVGFNVATGTQAAWAVTSIASSLMVSIYALGAVSGANFNPAVSLTLGLTQKMPWSDVGAYIVVQIIAGCAAGLSYGFTLGGAFQMFNLTPAAGFSYLQAGLAEVIYTCMLCFVVLNVAASKEHGGKNQFYGLAIAFVVVAGGYGAGHISGGCFNPAVAWGIDLSSWNVGFYWCLPYTAFEFVGAAIAAGLFMLVRPEEIPGAEAPKDGPPIVSKLASEFLGTYMLVLGVGLNVIGGSQAPVWSIAAGLMCMIFALGSVSGAHFNPAVTVAILASGRGCISVGDACMYIPVQIAGGIAAAFTYVLMENGKSFPLGPGKGFSWTQAAIAEIVFTFLLCYVVLSVATVREVLTEYFGLAIGSCVTAGGYAIGAISGGSLNPAVSFGIAVSGGTPLNAVYYAVFEIVGGVLAAAIFMSTHATEYVKDELP